MTEWRNEVNKNANGGTELMMQRVLNHFGDRINDIQLIPSRVRQLDNDKWRILWCHDLPDDPEAVQALGDGRWKRFHKIVFVSNWQMQQFIGKYSIPWSKCSVIENAIEPIDLTGFVPLEDRTYETINMIYHTTPHRGLRLLVPTFETLSKQVPGLNLLVYSSFNVYGWPERDQEYADVFAHLDKMPNVYNMGAVSNDEVRNALAGVDIFAYPSIWPETSCIALIEAMSAGVVCVHSNYGALYETACHQTVMYELHEDMQHHVNNFANTVFQVISMMRGSDNDVKYVNNRRLQQKAFTDYNFNWAARAMVWEQLFALVRQMPKDLTSSEQTILTSGS